MPKFSRKQWGLILGGLLLLIITIGAGIWYFGNNSTVEEEVPTRRRVTQPLNILDVSLRPYVFLTPQADGRNIRLVFQEVKQEVELVEYELEYQAGSLLQGAFGSLIFDSLPISETILFGSCSAGGACTYHEDIKGGSLLTRYDGPESYTLKSDWKYIDNRGRDSQVSSKDALFQLDSSDLTRQRFIVIFNAPGYPGKLPGNLMSEVYSLQTSSPLSGAGTLTMRAREEGNLVILGWNGSEWLEFPSQVEGRMVVAETELLEAYVVAMMPIE